jgi:hypothetical protein
MKPMPQFLSEGAEQTRDSPSEGESVELVVRVSRENLSMLSDWVVENEGTVIDSLEHGLLEIDLPETALPALCNNPEVQSVERADETIEVLDGGN